jgi:P-type conjugative transfer protein TrbJ
MKKLVLTTVALVLVASIPAYCVYPVIDSANLTQNVTTALKSVAIYAQQVQQYQTQLLQWKTELLQATGLAPALQIWQQAQRTMNEVTGLTSIFSNGGSVGGMLNQFRDVNYWLNTPVNSYNYPIYGSTLQKQANDAMFEGLARQTQEIQADAANLERLQSQAGSAQGQMQALTAANELAALQEKQLLQIRALLVQEQQALAARNSTVANDEAMRQAATTQFYNVQIGPQNSTGWKP